MNKFLACLTVAIAAVMAMPSPVHAQEINNPFEELSEMKGVETVFIGPALLRMAGELDVEGIKITKNIHGIGVYTISSRRVFKTAETMVKDYVKARKLDVMVTAKEDNETTQIWGSTNASGNITCMILLTSEPDECTLIYLKGDIPMSEISDLVHQSGGNASDVISQ